MTKNANDKTARTPAWHPDIDLLAMITFIANRMTTGGGGPVRKYFDLSITEARLLWLIGLEGSITAAETARTFGIDKAAVSRAASRLIELDLVRSEPDANHLARLRLTLTAKGDNWYRELNHFNEARATSLLTVLSAAERAQLDDMLRRLLHHVDVPNRLTLPLD